MDYQLFSASGTKVENRFATANVALLSHDSIVFRTKPFPQFLAPAFPGDKKGGKGDYCGQRDPQ
jgi:hypothetical protein